jgi:hypothetical protein
MTIHLRRELEHYKRDLTNAYKQELDRPCGENDWFSDEAKRYQGRLQAVDYILNRIELWSNQQP